MTENNVDLESVALDPTVPSVEYIERYGVRFPAFTAPGCQVCNSEYRVAIEAWYLRKVKAREILENLQHPDGLSANSIYQHFQRGHVPGHKTIALQHMLRKAAEQGVSLEEWEEAQADEFVAVETTVSKFRQRLADPDFTPDIKEGLAASKLLHEMKSSLNDGGYDPNDMFVALSTFMAHTRAIMLKYDPIRADEMMSDLGRLLNQDPVLQLLVEKTKKFEEDSMMDEQEDDEEVVYEAEVVPAAIGAWDDEREV